MILVTGSTGHVGGELLRALVAGGRPVRGLVRSEAAALPEGVVRAVGDLNVPESLRSALTGVDGLFMMPGYPAGVLAEAAEAGVERVVLLSGGSAVHATDTDNAVSQYMISSEEAVTSSGLDWTILRPTYFMSNTFEWAPQLRAGDVVRAPFADTSVAAIDPLDIAAVAAEVLVGDGHAGQAYRITGPESLLPAERLARLARVLGRELRFEAEPDDEAWARMSAAMPEKYVRAFFSFYVDRTLDESEVLGTVADVTGRPARTFDQWAGVHADAFTRGA